MEVRVSGTQCLPRSDLGVLQLYHRRQRSPPFPQKKVVGRRLGKKWQIRKGRKRRRRRRKRAG
jgi:hypothetical protein